MDKRHPNATTTPAMRAYIQTSDKSIAELAQELGLSRRTVRRWKERTTTEDQSSRPHRVHATLNDTEDLVAYSLRSLLGFSLDDSLAILRHFLRSDLSRAALYRSLCRHGANRLPHLQAGGGTPPRQTPGSQKGAAIAALLPLPESHGDGRIRIVAAIRDMESSRIEAALPDPAGGSVEGLLPRLHAGFAPSRIVALTILQTPGVGEEAVAHLLVEAGETCRRIGAVPGMNQYIARPAPPRDDPDAREAGRNGAAVAAPLSGLNSEEVVDLFRRYNAKVRLPSLKGRTPKEAARVQ